MADMLIQTAIWLSFSNTSLLVEEHGTHQYICCDIHAAVVMLHKSIRGSMINQNTNAILKSNWPKARNGFVPKELIAH